jgi:hypothetical protein
VLSAALLGTAAAPAGASEDSDEWEFVCLINNERITRGREPLRVTPGLRTLARNWAGTMDAFNNLAHNPNIGSQVTASVTSQWQRLGENVGSGMDVYSLHDAFMDSSGHRDNVLDTDWEYLGVGVSDTSSIIWTSHEFLSASVTLQTVTDPFHTFNDVCGNNPFFNEIEWMSDEGISEGYTDGTYRPNDVVTRQSMSAFMYRLAGSPTGSFPDPGFSDVATNSTFHREIAWMASTGITTGYPDGTFKPGGHVTREAMAAFMFRYEDPPPGSTFGDPGFSDVSVTHTFAEEIAWMADAGITTGYSDGSFRPGEPVTRQAMSAFMQRLAT